MNISTALKLIVKKKVQGSTFKLKLCNINSKFYNASMHIQSLCNYQPGHYHQPSSLNHKWLFSSSLPHLSPLKNSFGKEKVTRKINPKSMCVCKTCTLC